MLNCWVNSMRCLGIFFTPPPPFHPDGKLVHLRATHLAFSFFSPFEPQPPPPPLETSVQLYTFLIYKFGLCNSPPPPPPPTRISSKLPRFHENSFSYSGATLWNSLPYNIRESSSLHQFSPSIFLKTQHSWKSGL